MMKTFQIAILTVVLLCAAGLPSLFAQDAAAAQGQSGGGFGESEFYVVQIPIERVFTHRKGYIIEYRKSPFVNKRVYIPNEWFIPVKGNAEPLKAEIILTGTGKRWPQMSLYYKDGVVDHVRLYLRRDQRHFTWGILPPISDYDSQFENITDLKLEYK
ncbi:MAG: hypothetical protein LBD22_03690 [Spirochaetaceae bacterium]|nr:hypothetical protein [Spirochaetaceae bacterium]